jgi:hypothetical protein
LLSGGKGKEIDHLIIDHLPLKNGARLLTSRFKAKGKGKGKEKRCETLYWILNTQYWILNTEIVNTFRTFGLTSSDEPKNKCSRR